VNCLHLAAVKAPLAKGLTLSEYLDVMSDMVGKLVLELFQLFPRLWQHDLDLLLTATGSSDRVVSVLHNARGLGALVWAW